MSILNLLGITDAMAQQAAAPAGSLMGSLPILLLFIAVFYFVLIRPQSKRAKEHRELVKGLSKDDEVITTGGLTGKIIEVKDAFVVIRISKDVDVTFQKNAIAAVVPKGTFNV